MTVDEAILERIRNDIELNYRGLLRIEELRRWIRKRIPEYIEEFGNKIEPFILQVLLGIKERCPLLERDCDEVLEELGLSLDIIRVKVLDAISEEKLNKCILRVRNKVYEFDGECEIKARIPTTIEIEREGYESLKIEVAKPGDIVIKLSPCKIDVVVKVADKLGPLPNALVKVSPISFSGETEEFLTDQNGSFTLKLFNNQKYTFEVFIGNTSVHKETVHVDKEKYQIYLDVKDIFCRLTVTFKRKRGRQLKLFETKAHKPEFLQEAFKIVIYDERGNLIGKGINSEIIPLIRPVKLDEILDIRAYPLDKDDKYIPHLYDLLKIFMENQKKRIIQVNDQNLTIEIDEKEYEAKGLTLEFRETKSYKHLKEHKVPIFEVELEGSTPKTIQVSFGEYLGWSENDKVKAMFGGDEEKRLYEHQYKALHELENSNGRKCIIVSSGMASGKTEIAVLYLLKTYKQYPDFGYAVIVYPTRELLRDQYGRWKRYFDSAYDLGYLQSPVEVAMYYGEIAKLSKGSKELEKIKKGCCVILTTASTFCNQKFIDLLKHPLRLVVLDEIHFYRSFDLTILMEFLRFIRKGRREFEKLMIFSATIGNAEEFKEKVREALNISCYLISGEPVRGKKTVYVIDLSSFDESEQEGLIDNVLKEYYKSGKVRDKTIIFARNRNEAEDYYYEKLLKKWRGKRHARAVLHIGDMPMYEREVATERFRIGKCKWMITVKTLEVGIDIGDVSRIIHLGLPPSINEFTQREGRSGREGQESESIIFARTKGEFEKAKKWIEELKRRSTELFCKVIFNHRSLLAKKIQHEAGKNNKWPEKVKIGGLNIKCKVFGGFRFKLTLPATFKSKDEIFTRDVLLRYLPYNVRRRYRRGLYSKLYVKTIKIDDERSVILDYVEKNHRVRKNVERDDFYATTSHLETIIEEESRLSTSSLATVKVRLRPSHVNYIGRKLIPQVSKSGEIIKVPRYYIMDSFSITEAMAKKDLEKLEKLSEDFTRGFVINFKVPKDMIPKITKWVTEELEKDLREVGKREERKENLEEKWKKFAGEILWSIGSCIHLALHFLINTVVQSENIHPEEIEHYVCVGISEEEAFRTEIVTRLAAHWGIDDKVRIVEELSPKLNIKIVIGNKSDLIGSINWNDKSLNEYLEWLREADLETVLPLLEIHNCFVKPEEVLSFSKDFDGMKGIIYNLACEILEMVRDCADKLTVY